MPTRVFLDALLGVNNQQGGLGACSTPLSSANRQVLIEASAPDVLNADIGFSTLVQEKPIPALGHLGIIILTLVFAGYGAWVIRCRLV